MHRMVVLPQKTVFLSETSFQEGDFFEAETEAAIYHVKHGSARPYFPPLDDPEILVAEESKPKTPRKPDSGNDK